MEKRFLFAIILSFLVLYLWAATTPKTETEQFAKNFTQQYGTKEVTKESPILPSPKNFSVDENQKRLTVVEAINSIESDQLLLEFSNMGGVLNRVFLKEYKASLPIKNIIALRDFENVEFKLTELGQNSIKYAFEDEKYKINKKYTLLNQSYLIEAIIEIYNKIEMSKQDYFEINNFNLDLSILTDNKEESAKTNSNDKSLFEYSINKESGLLRKGNATKFSQKEKKTAMEKIKWTGFRNRYFCAIVHPLLENHSYTINPLSDKILQISVGFKDNISRADQPMQISSMIFVGPQKMDVLKEFNEGFEEIMVFSGFGLFNGIAKLIYSLIHWMYKIIPNWGICIILISILIYFSMYPLTLRGMSSMKKMQALQPQIASLKEKYKDNPQKINKEVMNIYKERKINPLGGCLPFLLQMPVFIGLYQVLWRSVSFKGAKFLWIKDLSEPDKLFIFPFNLPIVGNELNILPIIMMVVMFFQQRLSSKSMVLTDPAQVSQQKLMGTIFPVFLGFIFYKFASGLTLYFTMFYLFSTFTQWKMSKQTISSAGV